MSLRDATVGVETRGPELEGWLAKAAPLMRRGENLPNALERMGRKRASFAATRLSWDRPSPTRTKTVGASLVGLVHPDEQRLISKAAASRVSSFPDDFIFPGKFEDAWALMGNCVPPFFLASVASVIRGGTR